ncbi:MAG: type II toxin-antitoxin system VapC family toxin [Deltaproteobacteria bacterium]|nr:type II toxin-antitoxin system VapC family toxin [Deltaproteobacteria bacterium]
MIIDSSAIVAIVLREPGFEAVIGKLDGATYAGIGAPTLVETAVVLSARLGRDARGLLARLLDEAGIATVPFTEAHYGVAVDAWLAFGKGRHPAQLNFGDCLAYATAKAARQPLLCVGEDFAKTDLELA